MTGMDSLHYDRAPGCFHSAYSVGGGLERDRVRGSSHRGHRDGLWYPVDIRAEGVDVDFDRRRGFVSSWVEPEGWEVGASCGWAPYRHGCCPGRRGGVPSVRSPSLEGFPSARVSGTRLGACASPEYPGYGSDRSSFCAGTSPRQSRRQRRARARGYAQSRRQSYGAESGLPLRQHGLSTSLPPHDQRCETLPSSAASTPRSSHSSRLSFDDSISPSAFVSTAPSPSFTPREVVAQLADQERALRAYELRLRTLEGEIGNGWRDWEMVAGEGEEVVGRRENDGVWDNVHRRTRRKSDEDLWSFDDETGRNCGHGNFRSRDSW